MRNKPADRRVGIENGEKRGAQRDECDDHTLFLRGHKGLVFSFFFSPRLRDLYSDGASVDGIRVGQHHVLKCGDGRLAKGNL